MECRRILVVDGHRDAAKALAAVLELNKYEAVVETDGRAALAAAREHRPDAALLELSLQGISGHELCRRLRAEPWGGGILIIAVTGWARLEDRASARRSGFDHYLIKPVEFETLDRLLRGADRRARKAPRGS